MEDVSFQTKESPDASKKDEHLPGDILKHRLQRDAPSAHIETDA